MASAGLASRRRNFSDNSRVADDGGREPPPGPRAHRRRRAGRPVRIVAALELRRAVVAGGALGAALHPPARTPDQHALDGAAPGAGGRAGGAGADATDERVAALPLLLDAAGRADRRAGPHGRRHMGAAAGRLAHRDAAPVAAQAGGHPPRGRHAARGRERRVAALRVRVHLARAGRHRREGRAAAAAAAQRRGRGGGGGGGRGGARRGRGRAGVRRCSLERAALAGLADAGAAAAPALQVGPLHRARAVAAPARRQPGT